MATKKDDVELPEPRKSRFVGFRLDDELQELLDQLGDNRSGVLRELIRKSGHKVPTQERESAL
jgi:hypothetical protein